MAFADIPAIEDADFYLDLAFRRAKKAASLLSEKLKEIPPEKRFKQVEQQRISVASEVLQERFKEILVKFPKIQTMTQFYEELVQLQLDIGELKKSLGAVNWVVSTCNALRREYTDKIKKARDEKRIKEFKRSYYGRLSSVVKQINGNLKVIRHARKIFAAFPPIKSGMFTVALFGFPNVGKTTLISQITSSQPEINVYPFTTKQINIGYCILDGRKVQFLDTPGSLDRFDRMNNIEKQAHLALKHLADIIVYVFDLTDTYDIDKQYQLYETTLTQGKDVLVYFSKRDIIPEKKIEEFIRKHNLENCLISKEDLLQRVHKRSKAYYVEQKLLIDHNSEQTNDQIDGQDDETSDEEDMS